MNSKTMQLMMGTLAICLLCTAYVKYEVSQNQENRQQLKHMARMENNSWEESNVDNQIDVAARNVEDDSYYMEGVEETSCCWNLKNIPFLEPADSYDVQQILEGCDREVPIGNECYFKACCNSKTHQACNACCNTRVELGLSRDDQLQKCLDRCDHCFTCNFPEVETPAVVFPTPEGQLSCKQGGCTTKRTCVFGPRKEYCRCVSNYALEEYESIYENIL